VGVGVAGTAAGEPRATARDPSARRGAKEGPSGLLLRWAVRELGREEAEVQEVGWVQLGWVLGRVWLGLELGLALALGDAAAQLGKLVELGQAPQRQFAPGRRVGAVQPEAMITVALSLPLPQLQQPPP